MLNQVQNGMAVYATWGTLSTILNLTIYLQHQTVTSRCDCAMLSMLLLLMELLTWWALLPAVFWCLTAFFPLPLRDNTEQMHPNVLSSSFSPQVSLRKLLLRWACALYHDHLPCGNPVVNRHPEQFWLYWKSHLHLCRYCFNPELREISILHIFQFTSWWLIKFLCTLVIGL